VCNGCDGLLEITVCCQDGGCNYCGCLPVLIMGISDYIQQLY